MPKAAFQPADFAHCRLFFFFLSLYFRNGRQPGHGAGLILFSSSVPVHCWVVSCCSL
ncbi:unnamed protein product [Ixodes persulcatus]